MDSQEFNININILKYSMHNQNIFAHSASKFEPFIYIITKLADSHYDIIICSSVLLHKLFKSVISKLSIQISWTRRFFCFHHFQERKILQKVFFAKISFMSVIIANVL